jgi:integrase
MNLTADAIAALDLPEGKQEAFFWDDSIPGFGLRLRTVGRASRWIFQYRAGRQQRRVTLGALTAISVAQARKAASELHAKVRLGGDPSGDKAESRARQAETFGAILLPYLEFKRQELRRGSYVETQRHLLKHCKPLHAIPIAKLDRRAIAARLAYVAANSGNTAANHVNDSLSAFLSWCMQQGLIDSNPANGTTRYPEKSRDRVLTDAELKAIWESTADDSAYSGVVRLLLLTACRRDEIAGLRWSEIIGDRIVLPPNRVKNGLQHSIPLAPMASELLSQRPIRAGQDLVFATRQGRQLSGWTKLKSGLDRRLGDKVVDWTHHDLRRTCATRMAELGVQPHIIEAVLNHVSGHKRGVAGVYNRSTYEREKATALALWADHVIALVEGHPAKVVPLTRSTS